jgi:FkbH-like protein
MLTPDRSHLDYRLLLRESRRLDDASCREQRRIALLSDAAVPQLPPLLRVLFARRGVRVETYLAGFDATEVEVFDAASGLYAFAPDVVVLLPSLNALRLDYHRDVASQEGFAERVADHAATLWNAIRSQSTALVLQSTVVPPYERQFGNFDALVPGSFSAQVHRLNSALAARARAHTHVLVNDVAGIAAYVGLAHWFDERLWTLAKAYCALDHLPLVAQNVVDIVLAAMGRVVKCVAVDLDNTLWGGIVGEDGLEGIELDPFGAGEPYLRLQHYLRALKQRGIALAVCSKNDHATALEVFRRHPDMVLREDDIAVFAVNWGPKPDNLRHVQRTLNVGLDAIVFLDDDAFERRIVRETLPEVIVPELPPDPADYVRALAELNLFETTSFSDEDRRRADLYRATVHHAEVRAGFSDLSAYLASLGMRAAMRPFDRLSLPRVAQLVQRSNQFNLTTRRYSLPECEAMMEEASGYLPFAVMLADDVGDHGLVSVIILRRRPEALDIDTWLMSCRVLGRRVEHWAMNRVVALARSLGYAVVTGTYVPTRKNAMVADFFARFGFTPTGTGTGGTTTWRLEVATYEPFDVPMKETT